jgi:hypothetical protein
MTGSKLPLTIKTSKDYIKFSRPENRNITRQKSGKKTEDTAHQATGVLNTRLPKNSPKAAGLKICLFLILIRCFEAIAKNIINIVSNQEFFGKLSRAMMIPVTIAPERKKGLIFLILRKIYSKISVKPIVKTK